jgi:hypothetical protein
MGRKVSHSQLCDRAPITYAAAGTISISATGTPRQTARIASRFDLTSLRTGIMAGAL